MELTVHKSNASLTLSDEAFARPYNGDLVHQLVVGYAAAGRQGSHKQKTRAEVSGGGKKPWKQKGTGRARAGTTRGPLWRSGGATFAKVPRDYGKKMNRKMRTAAMQSIVSQLLREDRLVVAPTESLVPAEPRVKALHALTGDLLTQGMVLIVTNELHANLLLSSRNLAKVMVERIQEINPMHLVRADKVIFEQSAFEHLQEVWQS